MKRNIVFESGSNELMSTTSARLNEPSAVVQELAKRVESEESFFLVSRRKAPFPRTLALWQREARKHSPTGVHRVHYSGEEGIDTGAMSQEFHSRAISNMAREFLPDGTPTDSTCHVQNGNFRTCG